jgi:pyruvate dehydrogenase E2 component (dihydrolipoamide acetyltransferase)
VPRVLRMPEISASATEAVLSEWLVAERSGFGAADALATVETDKALVDIEADADGVVLKALVSPGTKVDVGAPIAVLGAPGEQVDDLDAVLRDLGVVDTVPTPAPPRREDPEVDPGSAAPVPAEPEPGVSHLDGRVFASPLARRMAREAGIPIEEIPGTGPRRRVLRRDVEDAMAARRSEPTAAAPAASISGSYDEVPHSRIRRLTAERLVASKREAPHFYLRATVRVERLLALRTELNAGGDLSVSVNDLVVKAVAAAHERVPDLNVTWTPDAVRRWHSADVAVAVATDRGLLTPVVRDVGGKSISAVSAEVRELAGRVRDGRVRAAELEGGSITVTNLGMYGVEEFAAIINPPHAAILAVGAVRQEPVVEADAVVPGSVMALTLAVDHRPVDGVVAARWLSELVALLEHPVRMLA